MKQEQEQEQPSADTESEDRKMSVSQEHVDVDGSRNGDTEGCDDVGERDDEHGSLNGSSSSRCSPGATDTVTAANDPNDQHEQNKRAPSAAASLSASRRRSLNRRRQGQDRHERDADDDPDFVLKVVQKRISSSSAGEEAQQQTLDASEATTPSVASIPAAAAPSIVAAVPAVRRTSSISKRRGSGSFSYSRRRSRSRSMSADSVDDRSTLSSPDSVAAEEEVGAFAISCSSNSNRPINTRSTELDNSATETTAATATATDTTISTTAAPPPELSEPAALAIAAEVAPEMIDLERSITDRLRKEITEQVVQQNSLRGSESSVVIAEIVQTLKEEVEEDLDDLDDDKEQRKRRRFRLLIGLLAILGVIAIIVGPVVDHCLKQPKSNLPDDSTVIAQVNETICYERIPLLGYSENCGPQPQGSGVTNLVAESRLWNVVEAQLSILNSGEAKLDLEQGDFTIGDARELLPFVGNELILIYISGSKLVTAMERGIQKLFDDNAAADSSLNSTTPSGSYPYGAGIRWSVNMTAPFPRRLYDIQVNPRLSFDWEPINLHQVYAVVTNSFLQAGGDSYHEFSVLEEDQVVHTGLYSLESFVDYCQGRGILVEPPLEFYSTQTYIHNPVLFDIS